MTEPDAVRLSVTNQGSNSSLLVSWSPPLGRLDYYIIHHSSPPKMQKLNKSSDHYVLGNLSAGQSYSVQMTVVSGPRNASSEPVTNATCKSCYSL